MVRVTKLRRPNGYWYVRYWIGGRPVDESARTKSETEAERYRLRREIEIGAGIQPLKHDDVGELIHRYLEALSQHTTAKHRHEVKRILMTFVQICGRKTRNGNFRLQTQQLTPEMVDRYIARRRLDDLSDLAELLFPGNRNHQHTFLVIWISLKRADHRMVPNLLQITKEHEISKRTFERVRAKMRRMGLMDHVSRFNAKRGYKEGWVLSNQFDRALQELASRVEDLKDTSKGSKDKDELLLDYANARRNITIKDKTEHGVI